jgi:hypothetical protein
VARSQARAERQSGNGGAGRRSLLHLLIGGAVMAAGLPNGRSVAAAAAVKDEAAQASSFIFYVFV